MVTVVSTVLLGVSLRVDLEFLGLGLGSNGPAYITGTVALDDIVIVTETVSQSKSRNTICLCRLGC